jgi:hypothetical protein
MLSYFEALKFVGDKQEDHSFEEEEKDASISSSLKH